MTFVAIGALRVKKKLCFTGWLYHTIESLGDKPTREQKAVHHLQKSIDVDNTNGQTWYLLGR